MTNEFWGATATIIAIIVSRVLSHFEHRKTNKMLNGTLEKQINEAVKKALEENNN